MGFSRESASEKLRRGQSLLASGMSDDANLGTALIALHGALEDRLRDLLASRLPERREDIMDSRAFQWKDILALSEQQLNLSKIDSDFIAQANIYRTTFAHSGSLRWTREGIRKYEELICLLWATGSRNSALSGPSTSLPPTPPKSLPRQAAAQPPRYSTAPLPYRGLPRIEVEDRPWYRSMGWYWIFFLFVLPVWGILILTDKNARKFSKLAAFLLMLVSLVGYLAVLVFFGVLPLPTIISGGAVNPTETLQPTAQVLLTNTPRAVQPAQIPSPTTAATVTATAVSSTPLACDIAWEQYPGNAMANKNRSMVWNEVVSERVKGSGMKPEAFIQQVVEYNPELKTDGYVFLRGKTYLLPLCK